MKKIITPDEAAAHVKSGMVVMVGGFLGNGSPHKIIAALLQGSARNLTIICNDTAMPDVGVGRLIANRQAKKVITSHIGTNPITSELMNAGQMPVEFVPQGTLAERIRCGGAGLGGVLTRTGIGTLVADGKEHITVDGVEYLLEKPLRADIALICGTYSDAAGNLKYSGTAQNFNPLMAAAADMVIAETENMVDIGDIPPEAVHTPAIFVDYIVK